MRCCAAPRRPARAPATTRYVRRRGCVQGPRLRRPHQALNKTRCPMYLRHACVASHSQAHHHRICASAGPNPWPRAQSRASYAGARSAPCPKGHGTAIDVTRGTPRGAAASGAPTGPHSQAHHHRICASAGPNPWPRAQSPACERERRTPSRKRAGTAIDVTRGTPRGAAASRAPTRQVSAPASSRFARQERPELPPRNAKVARAQGRHQNALELVEGIWSTMRKKPAGA